MPDITTVVRIITILLLIALVTILLMRRLSVPYTLGLVMVGLVISFFGTYFNISFTLAPNLVLFVFLPPLIFEGAWSISVPQLKRNWFPITILIGPGLLLELLFIALPLHFFFGLRWLTALLLSAILAPTDPIAVLALFRQLRVHAQLAAIIEGESLFNDGVAGSLYQVFLALLLLTTSSSSAQSAIQPWLQGAGIFLLEAGGGTLLGAAIGFAVSRMLRGVDDALIETTMTIVTAYGTYLLADALHTSGIVAVVIAGLILGSYGRETGMSERSQQAVETFWSTVAFVANALLFLLVGFQLDPFYFLSTPNPPALLVAAGVTILLVLLARLLVVLLLPRSLPKKEGMQVSSWRFVLFWSGLRGALSLALVLALPLSLPRRDLLVFSTYAVILFSLLVQGFSLRFILKRLPSVRA